MDLDYTEGCVNFRDVGEWLNMLADREVFPKGRLLRGGKLDFVLSAHDIGNPGTIINLRKGPDPEHLHFDADYLHFPISNDQEKYQTDNNDVKRWLDSIMYSLANDVKKFPVLFHCTSGKDRTGVVVASLLFAIGIDRDLIVQEYLLSDGGVKAEWINMALDGIKNPKDYFRRTDLAKLKYVIYEKP